MNSVETGVSWKPKISPASAWASPMNFDLAETNTSKNRSTDLAETNTSKYRFTDDEHSVELSVGSANSTFSALTTDDVSLLSRNKKIPTTRSYKLTGKAKDSTSSHQFVHQFVRELIAPPGKLGIIINSAEDDGPAVVFQVRNTSPLVNLIHVEDRIVGIDDIDTSEMKASDVTSIMARKGGESRKLTVWSAKP